MRRGYRSRYSVDKRNPYKFNLKQDGVRIECSKTTIDLTDFAGESTEESDDVETEIVENSQSAKESNSTKGLKNSKMSSKENILTCNNAVMKKKNEDMSAVISAKEKLRDEAFLVGLKNIKLKKAVSQDRNTMRTIRSKIHVLEDKIRKTNLLQKRQSVILENIVKKASGLEKKRSELVKHLQKLGEDVNEKNYIINQQTNTLAHTSRVIQSTNLGVAQANDLGTHLREFKSHLCFFIGVIGYNFEEACFVPASTKSLYKICLQKKFQLWESNVFEICPCAVTLTDKKDLITETVQWPYDIDKTDFKPFLFSSLFRLYSSFPPHLCRSVLFNNSWIDRDNPICAQSLTGDCLEINCLYQHLPPDMDTAILRSSIRDAISFISSFRDDSLLLFVSDIADDINLPLYINAESLIKQNIDKLIDIICKGKTIKQLMHLSDIILDHARKFILESNYINRNKLCEISNFILLYGKTFTTCNYSKYHWMRPEGSTESTSMSLLDESSLNNVSDTPKNYNDIYKEILSKIMSVNIERNDSLFNFNKTIQEIKNMIFEYSKVSIDLNLLKIFCSLCRDNSELLNAQHILDITHLKCNSDYTILRIYVNNCCESIESYTMLVRYLISNYSWRYEESEHDFMRSRLSLFFYEAILSLALSLEANHGVSSSCKLLQEVFNGEVVDDFYNLPMFFSHTYFEPIDMCSVALLYFMNTVPVSVYPFFTISQILPPIMYKRLLCCIRNRVSYSIDNSLDEKSSLSDLYARIDFDLTDIKSETLFGMLVEMQNVFNIINKKECSRSDETEFSIRFPCQCNMCEPRIVYRPEIGLLWKVYSSILDNTCNFDWFINNCKENLMNYAFHQDFFAKCYLLKAYCCCELGNYIEGDYIVDEDVYMKVCPQILITVSMDLLEQGCFTVVEDILEIVMNSYIDDFYLDINYRELFKTPPNEVLRESHFNSHALVEAYVNIGGFSFLYSNQTSKNDYVDFYMFYMLYSFLRREKIENERVVSSLNILIRSSTTSESDYFMFICYFFLRVNKLFFCWSVGVWKEIWLHGFINNFARVYSILISFKPKRNFSYQFYRYLILRLFYNSLSTNVQNQLEIYGFLRNNVSNFESTILSTRYMEMLCIWCKESYVKDIMRSTIKKDGGTWATWMQFAVYAASQGNNINEVYEYLAISIKKVLDGKTILAMNKLLEILEEARESRCAKHPMN